MEAETIIAKPNQWPAGTHADCACPHCGHVDSHQVTNPREWRLDCRDGQCSACFGDYVVIAKDGALQGEKLPSDARTFNIHHRYDIGDQSVTIKAPAGFDARRAAIYMQFWAEEWFGGEKMVTNLGVAAALVSFYGCKHAARNSCGEAINMHDDREARCGTGLKDDASLKREGLREFLVAHLDG